MTAEINRQDQIVYRFYLKTVGVLVDARLMGHAGAAGGGGAGGGEGQGKERDREREPKIDKWFNLPTPDPDLFRSDLAAYKTLSSTYSIPRSPTASSSALETSMLGPVPPLLIAITLDASGLGGVGGGGLGYRDKEGRGVRLDLSRAGAGGEDRHAQGIVLEQWTLTCSNPDASLPSSSTESTAHDRERPTYLAPSSSSAYKSGIIHFRALYQYLRLLPAYALHRRLRAHSQSQAQAGGGGLRIGIKMWVADGWGDVPGGFRRVPRGGISDDASTDLSDEERGSGGGAGTGLRDAWARMEEGLVGLEVPLGSLAVDGRDGSPSEEVKEYDFPAVPISNGLFSLSGRARADVDFYLEDDRRASGSRPSASREVASAAAGIPIPGRSGSGGGIDTDALDLNEEYFTPTLARRRTEDSPSSTRPSSLPSDGGVRRIAGLSATRPVRLDAQGGSAGASVPSSGGGRVEGFTPATQPTARPQITTAATTSAVPAATARADSGETSPTIQPPGTGSSGSLSRWAGIGQGLPFAVSPRERADSSSGGARPVGMDRLRTSSLSGRSSPNAIAILSRRQSSHGSRSNLLDMQDPAPRIGGGTPPTAESYRGGNSYEARPGSSLPRTNSFTSQSGRSFTRLSELPGRQVPSPGVLGTSAGSHRQLVSSPVVGSFQRTSSSTAIAQLPRPPLASNPSSPAQLPPTFEEDSPIDESSLHHSNIQSATGSPRAAPQMIKRYSASLGQRHVSGRSVTGTPPNASSGGSSGDNVGLGRSAGGSPGVMLPGTPSSLRRTSTRGSFDQGSLGNAGRFMGTSLSRVTSSSSPGDGDAINLFLKTLDTMPRPPSIAASGSASRPHLPSTSSSLSATHTPASVSARNSAPATPGVVLPTSPGAISSGAASGGSSSMMRRPLTKTALEEKLRYMADSCAGGFPGEPTGSSRDHQAAGLAIAAPAQPSDLRPTATRLPSSFATSFASNRQATDAIAELMSGGTSGGLQPRISPTSRDVSSLASRPSGSSVKSSSPLAGAPILAQPPTAPPSPASVLGARDAAAGIALPPSPAPLSDRERSYGTDQVERLPTPGTAYASSRGFTPLRPEDVPLPSGNGSPIGSRQPSVDAAAAREPLGSPRRAPVLIRGGFSQFSTPAVGSHDGMPLVHHHTGNGGASTAYSALSHRSRSSQGERSPMSMPERDPLTQRERDNEREYLVQLGDTGMTSALRRPGRQRQGTSDGRLTPSFGPAGSDAGQSATARLDRPISPNVWLGPSRFTHALSAESSPSNEPISRPHLGHRSVLSQGAQESAAHNRDRAYGDLGSIAPIPQPYRGRWLSDPVDEPADADMPSPWDDTTAGQTDQHDAEPDREADADDADGIVGSMEMGERRTRGA